MPENRIHICVGFYANMDYVINYVRDKDLKNNIAYNRTFRPGRAYFVDGEYVHGGMFNEEAMPAFIERCKQKLKELNPQPRSFPSPTYM